MGAPGNLEELQELFRHHIQSFDHLVEAGLDTLLLCIKPITVYDPSTKTNLRNILFSLSFSTFYFSFYAEDMVQLFYFMFSVNLSHNVLFQFSIRTDEVALKYIFVVYFNLSK